MRTVGDGTNDEIPEAIFGICPFVNASVVLRDGLLVSCVPLDPISFITDSVRSTTGRLCFDTCLSIHQSVCPHLGGYPSKVQGGTEPGPAQGGTPMGVPLMGGTPTGGYSDGGYPNRGYPDQGGYLDWGHPDRMYPDGGTLTGGTLMGSTLTGGYPNRRYPNWGYPDGVTLTGGYPNRGTQWGVP